MSYDGREVTVARLHASVHMLGAGNLASPITAASKTGLKMFKCQDGLIIKIGKEEGFVPNGNIQFLQFKPEIIPPAPTAKK